MEPEGVKEIIAVSFCSMIYTGSWIYVSLHRAFLVLCFAWILFTVCANIVRIFSLRLLDPNIRIEYIMDYNTAER